MPVEVEWLGIDSAGRVGLFLTWQFEDPIASLVECAFEPGELGELGLPWYRFEHDCGEDFYQLEGAGTLTEDELPAELVARARPVRLPVEFVGINLPICRILGRGEPQPPWMAFVKTFREAPGTRIWPPRAKSIGDGSQIFVNGRLAVTMRRERDEVILGLALPEPPEGATKDRHLWVFRVRLADEPSTAQVKSWLEQLRLTCPESEDEVDAVELGEGFTGASDWLWGRREWLLGAFLREDRREEFERHMRGALGRLTAEERVFMKHRLAEDSIGCWAPAARELGIAPGEVRMLQNAVFARLQEEASQFRLL